MVAYFTHRGIGLAYVRPVMYPARMTDAIPDEEFIATPEEALAAKLKLAETEVATLAAALVCIETMIEDSFSLWDGTMDMTTATMLLRRTQEIALEPWKSLESARPERDRMMRQNGELREHLWQLEGAVKIIDDNAEPLMALCAMLQGTEGEMTAGLQLLKNTCTGSA